MKKKYRKKPVVIEAIQFNGLNWGVIADWMGSKGPYDPMDPVIATTEGDMLVRVGDWVIKGIAGEFYPCKPDIFKATYEPA